MNREHLLELPQEGASIPLIESFIQDAYKQGRLTDAFSASRFLALIEAPLNPQKTQERLEEELKHDAIHGTYDASLHQLYLALPMIYLHALNDARKCIESVRSALAFEDLHHVLYVEIELAIKENHLGKATSLIKQYLHEMIPLESRFKALILKIKLEYELKDFSLVLESIQTLKNLASTHNKESEFVIAIYYLAKVKFFHQEYTQAIEYFSEVILFDLVEEYTMLSVIGRMESYIAIEKYHQASIDEAEYEERMLASNEAVVRRFFEVAIVLYQRYPNRLSLELYEKRLKDINKPQKAKPVKEKKPIIEEIKEEPENNHEPAEVTKVLPVGEKKAYSLESMETIHTLIEAVNGIDYTKPMRESLRQAFVVLSQYVPDFQALYFTIDQKIQLYHYKKERLYDKEKDWPFIEHTAIEYAMSHPSMHVFDAQSQKPFTKDILSQKDQATDGPERVVILPIVKDNELIAGLLVFFTTDEGLTEPSLDLVQAFKGILSNQFFLVSAVDDEAYYQAMTITLLEKHHLPIMRNIDHRITLNPAACQLLDLPEVINERDYFALFKDVETLNQYKQALKSPNKETEVLQYTLTIKQKPVMIEEKRVFGQTPSKATFVMSYLQDISAIEAMKAESESKRYLGSQEGLFNEEALLKRLSESLKTNKVTLMLFELDEQKMVHELYGLDCLNASKERFCTEILKHFKDAHIYEYLNRYVLFIEGMNDRRAIEKLVIKLGETLEKEAIYPPHKLYAKWSVGIIRYPVSTQEKHPDRLLRYLELSLSKAKRSRLDQYSYEFFDQEDYKRDVFEHTLINHMSDAIDQMKLEVAFVQAIDIVSNRVRHYEPVVRMHAYDVASNYIYALASKRGWSVFLDRYVIKKTLLEVKAIYDATQKYIKVNIPITTKTFKSRDFVPFMLDVLIKTEVPRELVTLELTQIRSSEETDVFLKIKELKDFHIAVGVNHLDSALVWPVSHVKIDALTKQLTNPKVVKYFESVVPMLHEENIDVIFSQANHDDLLKALRHIKADAVMGKSYGKHIVTQELIEKIGGMNRA